MSSLRMRERGFTLLELTVVLGLLAGFLMFLTQMLSGGVELFEEGEAGQELADLGNAAALAARGAVEDVAGPAREGYQPGPPDARLLLQWVPIGLARDADKAGRTQALRATVRITDAQETELLEAALRPRARQMEGAMDPEGVEARLAELVAATPRLGRAEMLLLPWPSADGDGAFLDLRRALLLPGERIPVDRRRQVGLMEVERLDDGTLPRAAIEALTTPIARGLLHFEVSLRSQYTASFDSPPGENGPEWVWDSARAGWLSRGDDPRARFSLDLGPESLENAVDDVYPRAARIVLVVASTGPPARLAQDIGAGGDRLRLITTDPLPDLERTPFLKVGSEWVRHGGVSGTVVTGLRRAQRGTVAAPHPQGTPVRAGKTIQLHVELQCGRDNWNG